jgi:hypothetical protein
MNADNQCGSHTVRLEEMTGAPGDVFLMHPAVLHAPAHNALDRPRLMLTVSVYRRGAYGSPASRGAATERPTRRLRGRS